ncbi:MAG TPA: DUF4097 family beta strand repeat-containing protein [Lachnospiraceae bacterium]|nr:DUF4097 family beta strand repeat-containing protein [Lachnospiraceae bacterium]
MKKIKITLIIILAIIVVGLIAVLSYFIATSNDLRVFQGRSNVILVKERSINMEEIDELLIDYSNNYFDVYLYESDSQELIVKEYMSEEFEQDKIAKIDSRGTGNLYIKGARMNSGFYWFGIRTGYVEVFFPKNYKGSFSIMTSSGEIVMDENWSSGKDISLSSSSGNIIAHEVVTNKILITSSSGNIDIKNLTGTFDVSSSSGNIKIMNGRGLGNATASSGNIIMELDEVVGNIELSTSSGNVKLKIPESTLFRFDANTSSGNINTFFDDKIAYNKKGNSAQGNIGSDSNTEIKIKASSGNITVSKK